MDTIYQIYNITSEETFQATKHLTVCLLLLTRTLIDLCKMVDGYVISTAESLGT